MGIAAGVGARRPETVGKFSRTDIFDANAYADDPHAGSGTMNTQ
jgi:hypothetical protein